MPKISESVFKIAPGETLSGIASTLGTTIQELQRVNTQITDPNKIFAGQSLVIPGAPKESIAPTPPVVEIAPIKPIEIPVDGEELQDTSMIVSKEVPLTEVTGGEVTTSFISGLTQDLATKRAAFENVITKEREALAKRRAEIEKNIQAIQTGKQDVLEQDVKPLLEPFRVELEKNERERLSVEKNFFANQASVEELETLLTQAQASIEAAEGVTGLAAIRNPRIQKVKEDVAARVGVIEAVMASRNNQISVAENMIDRSMNAITADRQDQLTYYESILNFYTEQKDDEGKKLVSINKQDEDFLKTQINLLESDLKTSQASVDFIKQKMLDPTQADIMERAGVKLTDSVGEIQKKLSADAYRQEIIDKNNSMEVEGFNPISREQAATKTTEEVTTIKDSRGVSRFYWKEPTVQERQITVDTPEGKFRVTFNESGQEISRFPIEGTAPTTVFTTEFFGSADVFNLEDSDFRDSAKDIFEKLGKKGSGTFGGVTDKDLEGAKDEIVGNLLEIVDTYKKAGFTDKQIFELMSVE